MRTDPAARAGRRVWRRPPLVASAAALCVCCLASPARAAELPPFAPLEAAVRGLFADAGYRDGELIVRSEARQAIALLADHGWRVPGAHSILARVVDDDEFLAQTLRTKQGRKLARQTSRYALGFDRLDHLSRLPRGRRMVGDLVRGPDGYKLIEYMVQAPGGVELGNMLGHVPRGRDFNEPTGRIYTLDQLITTLKVVHRRAELAAKRQARAGT